MANATHPSLVHKYLLIPGTEYENGFRGQVWINWTNEHVEIPIFCITIYLALIFWVPEQMKNRKPFALRTAFGLWNLLLSVFSTIGALRTVPFLIESLQQQGFRYTICEVPENWFLNGPVGLWTSLFIYSKIPELLDTVFLVLQKKPVIFLHWFHHVTVLLYCWHAWHHHTAPGLWFIAMNFTVHSVMYAYYFFNVIGLRAVVKAIAPLITAMQLLQMIIGMTVIASAGYERRFGNCTVDRANYKLGLAMYSAYAVLFAMLFRDLYLKPKGKKDAKGATHMCGVEMKQQPEAGGFFHPQSPREGSPKKKN